jgi:hypothetical protein
VTSVLSGNTQLGIVYKLLIHSDAVADLQAIQRAGDTRSYGVVLAFLQQAKADQQILESLSSDFFGVGGVENYDVKKWISQQQQGRQLWRVRLCDIKGLGVPYRILHAFDAVRSTYYVLAILDRGFNYDDSTPRVKRLLAVYDRLGIPGRR